MRILIFGASGFIGQNLMQILQEGCQIDSISLRDEKWKYAVNQNEIFINLIGKAHDHSGKATKDDFYIANFELVKEIYNSFIQSQAKLLIHISSLAALEEYKSNYPLKEEDKCVPQTWYGKSKRASEIWLLNQEIPQDKKIIILRPPMVHGTGDNGNLILLYKLVSKGIPYPLGAFENNRSFISIDNFNFFIKEIIKNHEQLETGIYHIADDEVISTNQIIEVIKKVHNKRVFNILLPKFLIKCVANVGDIIPIPLNTKRLKKMTGDLTISNQKIKQALGIKKLPLTAEEGLIKTIQSFKQLK